MSHTMIGKSKLMKELFSMIDRVAKAKTNILITGESGTGKELVARAIHFNSPWKEKPFVAVNCGAIPENLIESELFGHKRGSFTGAVSDKEGLFKVADGGTIFLDEVGELPLTMQVKLLRVLQDKALRPVGGTETIKVDARVISATNRNLDEAIVKGTFRDDLYYRLNVIQIKTPALRNRKEDLNDLIEYFLKKFNQSMKKNIKGVNKAALAVMFNYDWPGNVRELENTIERSMTLENENEITLDSLSSNLTGYLAPTKALAHDGFEDAETALARGNVQLEEIVGKIEKEYILKALEKTGGVKKKAAELLGVTFRSFRYRLAKYGIQELDPDAENETDEAEPDSTP